VKQKVVPVVVDAGALGSEMSVADDYHAESALKIAPSPLAWKPTASTCPRTKDKFLIICCQLQKSDSKKIMKLLDISEKIIY